MGRIFRQTHVVKHPLIVDLQDNFSVYKNQYSQRRAFYKQHFPQATMEEYQIDLDETLTENICFESLSLVKKTIKKTNNSVPIEG